MKLEIKAADKKGSEVELFIYDEIGEGFFGGGITAKAVASLLKEHEPKTIRVRLNSPGGDVFQGAAIYNLLRDHEAKVVVDVDGMALSAASVIAMAGDEIRMAENAMMMVHDPWTITAGAADDLRKDADRLDKVKASIVTTYARRTGKGEEELAQLMADETWMTAADAIELGFIDTITGEQKVAASVRPELLARFRRAPDELAPPAPRPLGSARRAVHLAAAHRAVAPTQPQPPSGPSPKDSDMKSLFAILALSANATEDDAIAAVRKLQTQAKLAADVEEIVGKSGPEAAGAVRGLQAKAAKADELQADIDKQKATQSRKDFDAAIKAGQDGRKLTKPVADMYRDRFENAAKAEGGDTAAVVADLNAFLAVAPTVGASADDKKQPATKADGGGNGGDDSALSLTHNGKTFDQMAPLERHNLKKADPTTYNAMRDEARAAGLV